MRTALFRSFPIQALQSAVLAALATAFASGASHASWPVVPLPPESRGEMVTEHMRNNGLDMQASVFMTPEPMESVLAFYRKQWGRRMVEDRVGNRTILGHDTGTHFISVELTASSGLTRGTVGILEAPDPGFEYTPGEGVILPSGSEVLSDVRFLDTREQPRFVTIVNHHTPYVNRQFYLQRLGPRGWGLSDSERCTATSFECMAVFEHVSDGRITLFARRTEIGPDAEKMTQVVIQMQ